MNIQEQIDVWGDENNWSANGDEWSIHFGSTKKLHEIILQKIENYLKGNVLEIAPGFGRMTKLLLSKDIILDIVDLNSNCIEKCQKMFGTKINSYTINNGFSLNFSSDNYDFIFSYDSFVHMSPDVIESYIKDMSKILKVGGYAFIHHSFFTGSDKPRNNIAGRSNMSPDVFRQLVNNNDMSIVSQENFRTSSQINDTITIFKK